jgi:hypothetical protein
MSDLPTVVSAIAQVMAEVTSVSKDDQFSGGQTRFAYRGVDRVVKALSGAMRKHRVVMLPVCSAIPEYIQVATSQGKPASMVRVLVTYRIYGPAGDYVEAAAPGEAMDSGDKAVSKAMSVAWRTALLQVFFLPTEEPDPDSEGYELGKAHAPAAPSPAIQKLNQYDAAQEAIRADWQAGIDAAKGDKEALTKLWQQATKQRIPADIIKAIEKAGTEAGK